MRRQPHQILVSFFELFVTLPPFYPEGKPKLHEFFKCSNAPAAAHDPTLLPCNPPYFFFPPHFTFPLPLPFLRPHLDSFSFARFLWKIADVFLSQEIFFTRPICFPPFLSSLFLLLPSQFSLLIKRKQKTSCSRWDGDILQVSHARWSGKKFKKIFSLCLFTSLRGWLSRWLI